MTERMKVIEYYDNPQQFLDEIQSINVRKLVNQSDKDLVKKYATVLYEQARLLEGLSIENIPEFVTSLTEIIK